MFFICDDGDDDDASIVIHVGDVCGDDRDDDVPIMMIRGTHRAYATMMVTKSRGNIIIPVPMCHSSDDANMAAVSWAVGRGHDMVTLDAWT
jgi:hypothetical protein